MLVLFFRGGRVGQRVMLLGNSGNARESGQTHSRDGSEVWPCAAPPWLLLPWAGPLVPPLCRPTITLKPRRQGEGGRGREPGRGRGRGKESQSQGEGWGLRERERAKEGEGEPGRWREREGEPGRGEGESPPTHSPLQYLQASLPSYPSNPIHPASPSEALPSSLPLAVVGELSQFSRL